MTGPELATREIHGHQIHLSEGRIVWAGKHDDSWYVSFNNGKGDLHKFRISLHLTPAALASTFRDNGFGTNLFWN